MSDETFHVPIGNSILAKSHWIKFWFNHINICVYRCAIYITCITFKMPKHCSKNWKETKTDDSSIHQSIAGDKCLSCIVNKYIYVCVMYTFSFARAFIPFPPKPNMRIKIWTVCNSLRCTRVIFNSILIFISRFTLSFEMHYVQIMVQRTQNRNIYMYLLPICILKYSNAAIDILWMQLIQWKLMNNAHKMQFQVIIQIYIINMKCF